jgi:hypothetical protein
MSGFLTDELENFKPSSLADLARTAKAIRLLRNQTQSFMAGECKMPITSYSAFECGKRPLHVFEELNVLRACKRLVGQQLKLKSDIYGGGV